MEQWGEIALQRALDKVAQNREIVGYPHITKQGHWITTADGDWTGGFWIGLLWIAFEERGDPRFREAADALLQNFAQRAHERRNHDLGFMFCPSAVAGWSITKNERYREIALQAAESLAAQFNAAAQFIPGWGYFGGQEWQGVGLIDTLMNLPLLLWAGEQTSNPRYREIALAHADTALRYHQRPDGSVYHVYRFDPETGQPRGGDTYQGLHAESSWARGQAWAITGWGILAQQTGEQRYLQAAQRVARYFLDALPASLVPFWDFHVTQEDAPRDSSAAAIAAYGLLRLADVSKEQTYADVAQNILRELSEDYLAPPEWSGILLHATADLPHGLGIDESTIYGDYFFVRALQRVSHGEEQPHPCC
jgi:unsaturated chondroitin disaccharide hydrolase